MSETITDDAALRKKVRERGPLAAVLAPGPVAALRQINALFDAYESKRGTGDPDTSALRQWMKDAVLAEYASDVPGLPSRPSRRKRPTSKRRDP